MNAWKEISHNTQLGLRIMLQNWPPRLCNYSWPCSGPDLRSPYSHCQIGIINRRTSQPLHSCFNKSNACNSPDLKTRLRQNIMTYNFLIVNLFSSYFHSVYSQKSSDAKAWRSLYERSVMWCSSALCWPGRELHHMNPVSLTSAVSFLLLFSFRNQNEERFTNLRVILAQGPC